MLASSSNFYHYSSLKPICYPSHFLSSPNYFFARLSLQNLPLPLPFFSFLLSLFYPTFSLPSAGFRPYLFSFFISAVFVFRLSQPLNSSPTQLLFPWLTSSLIKRLLTCCYRLFSPIVFIKPSYPLHVSHILHLLFSVLLLLFSQLLLSKLT
jgi:hypothetical protein